MTAAKKPAPPPDPPGTTCTPAQRRMATGWVDVWIWALVPGAVTAEPQVVWSEAKAGAMIRVSPIEDDMGSLFRVAP